MIADVGQGEVEEVDIVRRKGANLGWRVFEGRSRYTPGESAPGAIPPVIQRFHSDGNCSITGGVVVRDPVLSALRGRYVFGDFCRGVIESARLSGTKATRRARDPAARRLAVLVRGRRPPARVRDVAERPGLPARPALTVGDLADHGIVLVRADNPGPLTLTGTNTWLVGGWVVDPGPAIDAHLDAVAARGGQGRRGSRSRTTTRTTSKGSPGCWSGSATCRSSRPGAGAADGDVFGPLRVVALPGHSDDHLAFVAGRAAFCGDAVLGEGSVFVSSDLAGYLDGLRRLRALDLAVLCPGHGDPIWDVAGKLDGYIAHRLDRERRLLAALDSGLRSEDELLDAAWSDAPAELRPFAAMSLGAHLEKLRAEGRTNVNPAG